jgi:hypothetical protein
VISCGRLTSRRIAWRTRTSLNGAWSTRIVNGVIAPVCDTTVWMPEVDLSAVICGPSSAPAPCTTPVVSAFCSDALSLKSMIVSVST